MKKTKSVEKPKQPECLVDTLLAEIVWLNTLEAWSKAMFIKSSVHLLSLMEHIVNVNGILVFAKKWVFSQKNKFKSLSLDWVEIGSDSLRYNVLNVNRIFLKEILKPKEWDVQYVITVIFVQFAVKNGLDQTTTYVVTKDVILQISIWNQVLGIKFSN